MIGSSTSAIARGPAVTWLAMAILLSVTACSFQKKIAQNALDYNYSIESAHVRLTLLNILRAKDRAPMYFTRLGQVTGNLTSEATATANAAVGRPATSGDVDTNVFSLQSQGRYASSPSFVVQNLDSKEFYEGILRPIPPDVLELYWNQGWPKPLLIHMFVAKVYLPFTDNPEEVCFIDNYPPDREAFDTFATAVDLFLRGEPVIVESDDSVAFGPVIRAATADTRDIATLIDAQQARLDAEIVGDNIQLVKQTGTLHEIAYLATGQVARSHIRTEVDSGGLRRSRGPCQLEDLAKVTVDQADVHLRAPQGMIYYLGELARAQLAPPEEGGYLPEIRFNETRTAQGIRYVDPEPIFRVVTEGAEDMAVSVVYRGETFGVPDNEERSREVMALVQQVFSLFTAAKDLPSADTIRIAN